MDLAEFCTLFFDRIYMQFHIINSANPWVWEVLPCSGVFTSFFPQYLCFECNCLLLFKDIPRYLWSYCERNYFHDFSIHTTREQKVIINLTQLLIFRTTIRTCLQDVRYNLCCSSVTNIMQVNIHFLIGFKAHTMRWNLYWHIHRASPQIMLDTSEALTSWVWTAVGTSHCSWYQQKEIHTKVPKCGFTHTQSSPWVNPYPQRISVHGNGSGSTFSKSDDDVLTSQAT